MSKRIGPPFVNRTQRSSPMLTLRLIVIVETAKSRATSAMLSSGVIGSGVLIILGCALISLLRRIENARRVSAWFTAPDEAF
jgi:hypothetical protein